MIGKDSGSEAGITGIESNILHRKVRRAEDRRMPRTPFRHSDGSQSLSMPINSISHFWRQKRCKAAFTLAEVLITLGIIGIIAAMTLPSLINKAEKMILKNQFKKAYSTLTQALLKSEVDIGFTPQCYYPINDASSASGLTGKRYSNQDCDVFREILLKNLNVSQTCKGNAYPKGCIPKYKGFEDIAMEKNPDLSKEEALEQVKGQPGFQQQTILYEGNAYVLSDGVIIIAYLFPMIFAVDVNGNKGPNKWGYDLFSFFSGVTGKSNIILIGSPYSVEKGGLTTKEMIKSLYDDKK